MTQRDDNKVTKGNIYKHSSIFGNITLKQTTTIVDTLVPDEEKVVEKSEKSVFKVETLFYDSISMDIILNDYNRFLRPHQQGVH